MSHTIYAANGKVSHIHQHILASMIYFLSECALLWGLHYGLIIYIENKYIDLL
jgi:hypothetical protein